MRQVGPDPPRIGVVASLPRALQIAGLEWLFRIVLEPKRLLWRYLSTNPQAIFLLLTRTRGFDAGERPPPFVDEMVARHIVKTEYGAQ